MGPQLAHSLCRSPQHADSPLTHLAQSDLPFSSSSTLREPRLLRLERFFPRNLHVASSAPSVCEVFPEHTAERMELPYSLPSWSAFLHHTYHHDLCQVSSLFTYCLYRTPKQCRPHEVRGFVCFVSSRARISAWHSGGRQKIVIDLSIGHMFPYPFLALGSRAIIPVPTPPTHTHTEGNHLVVPTPFP